MAATRRPQLEILEDRLTPTTYGIPWPDPQHLTVSFVPDGTPIGTSKSNLFATMGDATPAATALWETQILGGLQAWAAVSNINLTVVPDDGAPLGTAAPLEGSASFGAIRIAATSLSDNLLATTTPFDPESGSWSGAMIFNSAYTFGTASTATYDTFSVAIHEAGHVFGLPSNVNDPNSVMFNYYTGTRTGLAPEDATAIQALYGVRSSDAWSSVPGGNATSATATNFTAAVAQQDITNVIQAGNVAKAAISYNSVNANLSSPNDVEYFKYLTTDPTGGFTVNVLTSNASLLEANVVVVDPNGAVVGSAAATDPQNGNLSIHVPNAEWLANYGIEVESATGGPFGVGAYQLQVVPDNASSPLVNLADAVFLALLNIYDTPHHTMANAAVVQPLSPNAALATTTVNLSSATDTEWVSVTAPSAANDGDGSLSLTLWSTNLSAVLPNITLVNANGCVQSPTVVTESNGSVVLHLADAVPGSKYYVKIHAAAGSTGGTFHLAFDFGVPLPDAPQTQTGTLALTAPGAVNFFTLNQTGVTQLQVAATSTNPLAGYEVAVIDSNGTVWYDKFILNTPNLQLNTTLVLPAGTYEVRISVGTQDGSDPGSVPYTVGIKQLNAPLGPSVNNPDNPSTQLWLEVPPGFFYTTNTDPYGSPLEFPIPPPRIPVLG